MIKELHARSLGVIADVRIDFEAGLNAITGETGAGKSLVVGALALLLGGRAEADAMRPGAETAEVQGRFDIDDDTRAVLAGQGIDAGDEIVITRKLRASGSRAYVNDTMVTVGILASLAPALVEIVGQHSARSLVSNTAQIDALDRFAGAGEVRTRVRQAHDRCAELRREIDALGGEPEALAREADMLAFQIDEIDEAAITREEPDSVTTQIDRLAHAQEHRRDADEARETVDSARDLLASGTAGLQEFGGAEIGPVRDSLAAVLAGLDDISGELRVYIDRCRDDPELLESLQERKALLTGLFRKYGPDIEAVLAFRNRADARLGDIKDADRRCIELGARLEQTQGELEEACVELSEIRAAAAGPLGETVTEGLHDLELGGARFEIEISQQVDPSAAGSDAVEFLFAGGPNQQLRPLRSVASGGELSRVMLALAGAVSGIDTAPTLVFDEIDAGTGGEAAVAVGHALGGLATGGRQLLCVTHLAQVACFADHHVALRKNTSGVASAAELDDDARIVELSRMLSGTPESDRAREHAAELVEAASAFKKSALMPADKASSQPDDNSPKNHK